MPSLLVTAGLNNGDYYPVSMGVFTIGRDATCTAQLIDDRISRTHVRVRFDHDADAHVVEDAGSSNGTTLNGKPLEQAQPLNDGDQIGLGDSALRFSTQDFPDKESALKHYHDRRWFGEDTRQTMI